MFGSLIESEARSLVSTLTPIRCHSLVRVEGMVRNHREVSGDWWNHRHQYWSSDRGCMVGRQSGINAMAVLLTNGIATFLCD